MQSIDEYRLATHSMVLEDLVREHSVLVLKIAKKIKRKLPSHIELDDLVQSGFIGLIEAAKSFKSDQGASFETFASIRIRGSILDDLRKSSWNSREVIKNLKEVGMAVNKVEQKHMRPASAEEVAKEMNLTLEEYDHICQHINTNNVTRISDTGDDDQMASDEPSPEVHATDSDLKARVQAILPTLPEREQILLSLYYIEELTFREISEVLNLTEARVCQIHASVLAKLSRKI